MRSGLSRHLAILLKVGFSVVVSATVLALLEGGSYLLGTFEGPGSPLRGGYIETLGRHDPLLFWSLRPSFTDPTGRIRTNRHGLRGPEILAKEEGELRILSLGESTTLAPRLSLEENYSFLLEKRLGDGMAGRPVRVVNGGVSGYSLFQGYQYLRHRGFALDPDVVMLYFGYNDFLPVSFLATRSGDDAKLVRGLDDWELFETRQAAGERIRSFLTRHSNLYRAFNYGGSGRGEAFDRDEVQTDPDRPRVPEGDRRRLLALVRGLCRDRDIELVIIVPWYASFEAHAPLLREFGGREGLIVVDLPTVLGDERLSRPRAEYFVDAVHPTAEGHGQIADAIYEALRQVPLREPESTLAAPTHDHRSDPPRRWQ